MRFIIVLLVGLIWVKEAGAQSKSTKKFTFPTNISPRDYQAGKVLVKIKSQYKQSFSNNGRSASLLPGIVRPIATGQGKTIATRMQAFKPKIDISQYFEISFDPSIPVDQFISDLYKKEYIEIAEPVYRERLLSTPNDPAASSQYYLSKIKAYEAWDITQGSEDIIIAIVDSGVDIDHPDLANKFYINEADPVNGLDDDNNGYIDDYRGWDFSGADTLNAFDPSFVGDNDPSINKNGPGFTHGTQVGGCASASTNDGVGMAGVGYNTRLMFIKHYADNQPSSDRSYSSNLYLGVIYAAENGAKIINCSWGSSYRSQVYQDIITHVTLDLGCLVIAAAGNDGTSNALYPASYDYTLSVGSTDQNDKRSFFSNYGSNLDLCAPGSDIYTSRFDNSYSFDSGTSFSSPITAGAAALVWATHPEFTGVQVGEQLRVTADESMYDQNSTLKNQLGKGRLNIYRALTESSPSIRALNYELTNTQGESAEPGDNALLYFDFKNYLQSSSGALEISISTTSSAITISQGTINPGVISAGETVRNTAVPFELSISSSIAENVSVDLLITFSDGAYQDFQAFSFVPNPSYRNIDDNKVITTISGSGKLAFENTQTSSGGVGFIFNDNSILYEMGVVLGTSSSSILNTVRNGSGGFDADFVSIERIKEIVPGKRSSAEIFGAYSNSKTESSQQVVVSYRSLVWREKPHDQFIILEYKIKNPQNVALNNFYFGLFADWDISFGGAKDAARWDSDTKLGYAFPKQSSSLPHAGIQLLSENANYYAIDNDHTISGNPLGLYDGFTDTEKYNSLSSGFFKIEAGNSSAAGNDVSHVVSSGPYTINPDEEVTIAFALHAANNLDGLITSAKYADSVYNFTLKAPQPEVDTALAECGGTGVLMATGASSFHWYRDFTGGEPVASGSQFSISGLLKDTTVYVSNADHSYESVRVPAYIRISGPVSNFSISPIIGSSAVEFTDESTDAAKWFWDFGDGVTSEEQNPVHTYTTSGNFVVRQTVTNVDGCENMSEDGVSIALSECSVCVFPVPLLEGDELKISFNGAEVDNVSLTLIGGQGNELRQEHYTDVSAIITLNLKYVTPGIYFLKILADSQLTVKKIIVTK